MALSVPPMFSIVTFHIIDLCFSSHIPKYHDDCNGNKTPHAFPSNNRNWKAIPWLFSFYISQIKKKGSSERGKCINKTGNRFDGSSCASFTFSLRHWAIDFRSAWQKKELFYSAASVRKAFAWYFFFVVFWWLECTKKGNKI